MSTPAADASLANPHQLEAVLITAELDRRPRRQPDLVRENEALHSLAEYMAHRPGQLLDHLVQIAVELCDADSAGVSLLEGAAGAEEIFRWTALAGEFSRYAGRTMPRHWSPCGTCLDTGAPVLFSYPGRCFTYLDEVPEPIVEALVIPFAVRGSAIGALWIVSHEPARVFDSEDVRFMTSLANFTATALELVDGRREIEEQRNRLQEADERYRLALYASGTVMWDWNIRTGEVVWSPSIRQHFGYSDTSSASAYDLWTQRIHPEDRNRVSQSLRAAVESGPDLWQEDYRFLRSDGTYAAVSDQAYIARDTAGKPIRAVGSMADITQRRAAEELLVRRSEELARSNSELQQFGYVISHDLQEPLRMITTYSQLLRRKFQSSFDEEAHQYVDYVVNGAMRMNSFIEDLLAYSRVAHTGRSPAAPANLNEIAAWAVLNLRTVIQESGSTVTTGELPIVAGEPMLLMQVFQNLISNAIKYRGAEPPRIEINAQKQDDMWRISVRDNGTGIDPRYHERIFGLFKRLHGGDVPGTGIGLAICKTIVERHDGSIWVESQPGEGATFHFTLPEA